MLDAQIQSLANAAAELCPAGSRRLLARTVSNALVTIRRLFDKARQNVLASDRLCRPPSRRPWVKIKSRQHPTFSGVLDQF